MTAARMVVIFAETIRRLGGAVAANEPGFRGEGNLYHADVTGEVASRQAIDETILIDPASPPDIHLAAVDARSRFATRLPLLKLQ